MRLLLVPLLLAVACKKSTPTEPAAAVAPEAPADAGDAAAASADAPDTAALEAWLDALNDKGKWMGSLVAARNGETLFALQRGTREADGGGAIDVDTRFRIGSITKMYTSVVIHQLVEEEKLAMDATIDAWFPDVPNASKITVEQLLDHHSGLFNFTNHPDYTEWMEKPKTKDELLALFAEDKPSFEPGAAGGYSNTGYLLLGFLIEAVEDKPYGEVVQARILDKLGTTRTHPGKPIEVSENEAASLAWKGTAWGENTETDPSVPHAAGAIVSTPTELCTFAEALFTGKLVSDDSLASMQTLDDDYGHGLFRFPWYDRWSWGHTGGIDGFGSVLGYFPDDGVCFALVSHAQNTDQNAISIGVLSTIYGRDDWEAPEVADVVVVPTETLDSYTGVWKAPDFPLDMTIARDGAVLTGQGTGQPAFPFTPKSDTEFVFEQAGVRVLFEGEGDALEMVLFQGPMTVRFTRE